MPPLSPSGQLKTSSGQRKFDRSLALIITTLAMVSATYAEDRPYSESPPSSVPAQAEKLFGPTTTPFVDRDSTIDLVSAPKNDLQPVPETREFPEASAEEDPNSLYPDILPEPESISLIDLAGALSLAEVRNPNIGLSREKICEAVADRKAARALWLPTLNAGTNYHLNRGVLITSFGDVRKLNEQSLYIGGGARVLAAETLAIPAVSFVTHLGDAYFTPLEKNQLVNARSFDSRAVENLTLFNVSDRYLRLVAAEAKRDAMRASLREINQIEDATEAFAEAGQGRDADARRAHTELLLMQLEEQQLQEEVGVAAAELSRLLHLDPSVRLTTPPGPIELIDLVDIHMPIDSLVRIALQRRPEISSRSSEIVAADYRLRQEQTRPMLPLIKVGFSGGAYGGGSNRQDLGVPPGFSALLGRTDFDVFAVWTLQNLGVGNEALQNRACAAREEAIRQRSLSLAQIREEILTQVAVAKQWESSIDVAWRQLGAAEKGAAEDLARTRAGEGLPIEALNSMTRLATARQQLIQAVISYNTTQLRLYVATGATPRSGQSELSSSNVQ